MKNPLPLEASWWAEFRPLFRMSKFIIFMQPPCINFPQYHERSVTVGCIVMSRIQNTFHNVEGYYFYAAAIFNFLRYCEKSFTFGSVLMIRIRTTFQNVEVYYFYADPYTLFLKYYENPLSFEASLWVQFRTLLRMSKYIF